nr:endothelin-converting enzyme 2-like [Dermacentor andersoni]
MQGGSPPSPTEASKRSGASSPALAPVHQVPRRADTGAAAAATTSGPSKATGENDAESAAGSPGTSGQTTPAATQDTPTGPDGREHGTKTTGAASPADKGAAALPTDPSTCSSSPEAGHGHGRGRYAACAKRRRIVIGNLVDFERRISRVPFMQTARAASLPLTLSPRGRRHTKDRDNGTLIATAATMTVLLTLVVLLFFLMPSKSRSPEQIQGREALCRTVGCRYYAEILAGAVNATISPCDDFEGYACSSWAPFAHPYSYGMASMSSAMGAWYEGFRNIFLDGSRQQRFGRKVDAAFASCMLTSPEDSTRGISELKAFMGQLRIPWPDAPLAGVDPLGVILDLSLNWRLDIWLSATLRRCPHGCAASGGRHILLDATSFFTVRVNLQRDLSALKSYMTYWNRFSNAFFAPGYPDRSEEHINRIAMVERSVFDRFLLVGKKIAVQPVQFELGSIHHVTPNIPESRWIDQLSSNVKSLGDFHRNDSVTVWDRDLLYAVNEMFVNYTREELLEHISWTFVQNFGPLADRELLVKQYGDRRTAAAHRHIFCATQIEIAYQWLFTSTYAKDHFTTQTRNGIDTLLASVTQAAVDKIYSVAWADDASKQALVDHVRNVTVVLWPGKSLLTDKSIYKLEEFLFVDENNLFVQQWIWAMKKWRSLRDDPTYSESDNSPRNYALPYFKYTHVLNRVSISLAALSRPWYYADGTKAMSYGTVGFSFARELARSFDPFTVPVDMRGQAALFRPPNAWAVASRRRASCLSPFYGTPFPEIPALEFAYQAFKESVASRNDSERRVSSSISDEQLFFLSACFTMCNLPETMDSYRLHCNKAVSNFAPFAHAFGCRNGTQMSPPIKCSYLDCSASTFCSHF